MEKPITYLDACEMLQGGCCPVCGDNLVFTCNATTHGEGEIFLQADCCEMEHLLCIETRCDILHIIRRHPFEI